MSTATALDPIVDLANFARQSASFYAKDLLALSQEAFQTPCGDCTRTMQDVSAEVCDFNFYATAVLKGEAPSQRSDEDRSAFIASLSSPEVAGNMVVSSANDLADQLVASRESLGEMTRTPWGADISKFMLALIAINHIMYHDGQITFVQSLNGDKEMHWFDA